MRIEVSEALRVAPRMVGLECIARFAWGAAYAGIFPELHLKGRLVIVLQDTTSRSTSNVWFVYNDPTEYVADVAYLQRRGGGEPPFGALVPAGPRSPRRSGADAKPLPEESE